MKILIAPKDLMFLLGTKLDFETTHFAVELHLSESRTRRGACGCGESVSITPAGEAQGEAV